MSYVSLHGYIAWKRFGSLNATFSVWKNQSTITFHSPLQVCCWSTLKKSACLLNRRLICSTSSKGKSQERTTLIDTDLSSLQMILCRTDSAHKFTIPIMTHTWPNCLNQPLSTFAVSLLCVLSRRTCSLVVLNSHVPWGCYFWPALCVFYNLQIIEK